jgi:hypothetical protein
MRGKKFVAPHCGECGRPIRNSEFPDYYAEREFRLWGLCWEDQKKLFPTLALAPEDLPEPASLIDDVELPELLLDSKVPVAFGTEDRNAEAIHKKAVVWPTAMHLLSFLRFDRSLAPIISVAAVPDLRLLPHLRALKRLQRPDWQSVKGELLSFVLQLRHDQHPVLQQVLARTQPPLYCPADPEVSRILDLIRENDDDPNAARPYD